jgi:hypothetical protein
LQSRHGRGFVTGTSPRPRIHPEWKNLKAGLIGQNLRNPAPRVLGGHFLLDHDLLGEIDVFDLHPNNVIQDATRWLHLTVERQI